MTNHTCLNKNNVFLLLLAVSVGVAYGYIYQILVVSSPTTKFKKHTESLPVIGDTATVNLNLPPDSYLLRFRGERYLASVSVENQLIDYKIKKPPYSYVHVPKRLFPQKGNPIKIFFFEWSYYSLLELQVRNYRSNFAQHAYVLYTDSIHLPQDTSFQWALLGILPVFAVLLYMVYLTKEDISSSLFDSTPHVVLSGLPALICFSILAVINEHIHYAVVLSPGFFLFVSIMGFLAMESIVLKTLKFEYPSILSEDILPRLYNSLRKWHTLLRHDLSSAFISVSLIILMLCVLLFGCGLKNPAELLANAAYAFLVAGIFTGLCKFLIERH